MLAPPRMTIQDVPFKPAVRASMPPHVEKHFTAPRPAHVMNLFQLRPDFPNVPPFPELRLSLFQSRHTVRERHGTGGGHRPEPAQIVGTATGRVNAANRSSAAVHGVVRSVLFNPGAETSRTQGERHQDFLSCKLRRSSSIARSASISSWIISAGDSCRTSA